MMWLVLFVFAFGMLLGVVLTLALLTVRVPYQHRAEVESMERHPSSQPVRPWGWDL